MGLYQLLVVPAIEPARRAGPPLPIFSGSLDGDQWWQHLFAADDWQNSSPKVVRSKNRGILLSMKWEQVGPKSLKLEPLTMIVPQYDRRQGPADKRVGPSTVWIVNAEQGATIHFEEAFDPASGAIPSVARGHLSGDIVITRKILEQQDAEAWTLKTSDLFVDQGMVFTQKDVEIRWPEGVIRGHDLRITLQGNLLSSSASDAWGPLRDMELYHIDEFDVRLPDGGLWGSLRPPQIEERPDLLAQPARLQVSCGGRFSFDFSRSRATLLNGVHVVHRLGDLEADEFLSQEVHVQLEPGLVKRTAQTGADRSRGLAMGGFQMREFEAIGVDSLQNFVGEKKVEFRAPTIDAFASAKRLRVNIKEQRVELDGKLPHPGATQSTAWIEYMGYKFSSPRIEYDADGDGTDPRTDHLGYLVAGGAGELRLPATASLGETLVRWQDVLEMRPSEKAGVQWIGLFGNVLVESTSHGLMAADRLEAWLREEEPTAGAQADRPPADNASPVQESAVAHSYSPERVHAVGDVMLATPQLTAEIDEMKLALLYPPPPAAAASGGATTPPQDQLTLSNSEGMPMYQWVQPPAAPPPASSSPSQAPTEPARISGKTLSSTIVVAGKQSWVDELTLTGPLTARSASDSAMPVEVEGQQLQLATNPAGQVDMIISGEPARIQLADGALLGPRIGLDQSNNLVWMDQPGELTIPLSALTPRGESESATSELHWFEAPRCNWQGRMQFDGKAVRIEGDIEFGGAVQTSPDQFWWIKGYAQSLLLELETAVDMNEPTNQAPQPARMTISNNVNILASQLDSRGNRRSREQMQVPSLTFDFLSNEIIGNGPGSIRSWHLTKARLGKMASSGANQAAEQLQGAHLAFRDSMRGFLDRSELYFQGNVELAAGPLKSWDDAVDLAQLRQLSLDQMLLECDLLKIYDTSGLSSTPLVSKQRSSDKSWDFQAKGNVVFEGKAESGNYEGNGSELTYSQAKELLYLFGDPRRPASFRRIPNDANADGEFSASVEYLAFNPRTWTFESYKLGQNGFQYTLPQAEQNSSAGPQPAPVQQPAAPNPRGSVDDFLQRKRP